MRTSDFDYYLPDELIAQHPAEERDLSRLMVLHRRNGRVEHRLFAHIVEYFNPGDVLVLNSTRVIPARLYGRKSTGAKVEVVLLTRKSRDEWEALVRPGKKLQPGTEIIFGHGELIGHVVDYAVGGGRLIRFSYDGLFEEVLNKIGEIPLPPYIHQELADKERYQTVYAKHAGSAAAPTAGLHFTDRLLGKIEEKGVVLAYLLLHVGLGTFRPVKVSDLTQHRMHEEYFSISSDTAAKINAARAKGRRVIAVGTTTVRALESAADELGNVKAASGWTDIFIYPGYKFKTVDALITNFHLPRSTLLMLVSAFAGRERVLEAYREAVKLRYRFFSFGDAMLIL